MYGLLVYLYVILAELKTGLSVCRPKFSTKCRNFPSILRPQLVNTLKENILRLLFGQCFTVIRFRAKMLAANGKSNSRGRAWLSFVSPVLLRGIRHFCGSINDIKRLKTTTNTP